MNNRHLFSGVLVAAALFCFALSGCGSHDQQNAAPPPGIHPSSMTAAQRQQIENQLHGTAPAPAGASSH